MPKQITLSTLTVGTIVAIGYALQITTGEFDIRLLAAPVNQFLGGKIVLLCAAAAFFSESRFVRWFTGVPMSVCLISALGVLALIMGLTPQGAAPAGGVAAVAARLGFNAMTTSWPFVLVYYTMLLSLGALAARRVADALAARRFGFGDLGFHLNHIGLWLVLMAAGLGNADMRRYTVRVDEGTGATMGYDSATGHPRHLPVEVRLHDFVMEEYEPLNPGDAPKPRRYASDIELTRLDNQATMRGVVEVNHPLRFAGWRFYQYGYDRAAGPASTYSLVEMVRDPWIGAVYAGFAMIALGAFTMLWRGRKPFSIVAVAAIAIWMTIRLARGDAPRTPVPALQSIWFIPHVGAYIVAYSLMAAATVMAIVGLIRLACDKRAAVGGVGAKFTGFVDGFVYAGFGMLVLGMLMGAVWAKEAWGHYWEWDPKETWALVTIFAYLVYIHLRLMGGGARREKVVLWVLVIAFVTLMITWIGVNYLPSAQSSIHVY
jgi:ABC-type transport system involved in cytochrome c biogenesis permease subunit